MHRQLSITSSSSRQTRRCRLIEKQSKNIVELKLVWANMITTNASRLKAYKEKMKAVGFKRLSIYVHPDLAAFLERERKPHECGGRVLERLLLGEARKRPPHR